MLIEKVAIINKETLHKVIDEMIETLPIKPSEIGMCVSYAKLDDELDINGEYKGIPITYYNEWFSQGRIIIR